MINGIKQYMRKHKFPLLCIFYLSVLFTACACSVTMKYAAIGNHMSAFQSIFVKTTALALILTPFYIKKIFSIRKRDLQMLLITIICAMFDVYIVTFSWVNLPVNNATILSFFHPFIMTFLAWIILSEKISKRYIVSMIIGFCGVALSINWTGSNGNEGSLSWYGMLFSNLFISGIGLISMKKLSKFYPSSFIVYIRTLAICICSIFTLDAIPSLDRNSLPLMSILIFGYLYERISVAKIYSIIDVSKIQPLKFMNIVFASILGYLVLDEKVTQNQVYSVCLIMIAMYIAYSKKSRKLSNHSQF